MAGWTVVIASFAQNPVLVPVAGPQANFTRIRFVRGALGWLSAKLLAGEHSPAHLFDFLEQAYGVEVIEVEVLEKGSYPHPGTGRIWKKWGAVNLLSVIVNRVLGDMKGFTGGATQPARFYIPTDDSPMYEELLRVYRDLAEEVRQLDGLS